MSEVSKHRELVAPFCKGNGVDIGSGGDPVVPWAVSIDLPPDAAEQYSTTFWNESRVNFRGSARDLEWFVSESLDFVFSSHVLEDFHDWPVVLLEWMRVVKPGGHLVLLVPEVTLWAQAVEAGQPMNHNHAHEFTLGEISSYIEGFEDWCLVKECMAQPELRTDVDTPDYTILAVFKKAACDV